MPEDEKNREARPRPKEPPYDLPQEEGEPQAEAVDAARTGDVPEAAPGLAGESAPGEPSRAEVFALNPELAADNGVSPAGAPTMPVGPDAPEHEAAGAPLQGKTAPLRSAPPGERPADTSTPAERNQEKEPPKAPWGDPKHSPRSSSR